jgi:hypothetical protein
VPLLPRWGLHEQPRGRTNDRGLRYACPALKLYVEALDSLPRGRCQCRPILRMALVSERGLAHTGMVLAPGTPKLGHLLGARLRAPEKGTY